MRPVTSVRDAPTFIDVELMPIPSAFPLGIKRSNKILTLFWLTGELWPSLAPPR
jgi:hypothetical protein